MKILMVNKFLYPNGGSETYIFEIGKQLQKMGHEVQYFGMEHAGRIVGNRVESYTSCMDFHTGKLAKLAYPFRIIYSSEARRKIRRVLDDFQPDVVHLNNFNFQLTPSILYEIRKYEKASSRDIRVIYTAHDYQLVCPNHMMRIPGTGENCERCLKKGYSECVKHRCIHESFLRSLIGAAEGYLYRGIKTYQYLDCLICPSRFMEEKLEKNPLFRGKTKVLHNFVDVPSSLSREKTEKKAYILYFGRFAEEKGIHTLLEACRKFPEIPFIFAGSGPMEKEVNQADNICNAGFQTGDALVRLISEAAFSICPSEWYENCPFSVMESLAYGTPVLGAKIGGIPELIQEGKNGELFQSGDLDSLCDKIWTLWNDEEKLREYQQNCQIKSFDTVEEYCEKLLALYEDKGGDGRK